MSRVTRQPTKPVPLGRGLGSIWRGWSKTIEEAFEQLRREAHGLALRTQAPVVIGGSPAAYTATKVFKPETDTVSVDHDQNNSSATQNCNYVLRDGALYEIPIQLPGPGVFVAHCLTVATYIRTFRPTYGVMYLPVAQNTNYFLPTLPAKFTTKFCLFPRQPRLSTNANSAYMGMNFFWNMHDTKSGRKLSDDLIPGMALMPRSPLATDGVQKNYPLADGSTFEFDVPWLFERDGQANFVFRPITPIFQFDSAIAGTDSAIGLSYDDRESSVRRNDVIVQVELQGHRFETEQDALKAGAMFK